MGSVGAKAARIKAMLDGMCVNTIVLMRPIRREIHAATGNENADSTPDQKKNTLAVASACSRGTNTLTLPDDGLTVPAKAMTKSTA